MPTNKTQSNISNQDFKIFHQNIQNLQSRKESLEIVLTELTPDVVVLTEHNMKCFELERFNLDNHSISSYYARTTTTGGGVLILSRKNIRGKQLTLPSIKQYCEDKLFECCISKFKIKNRSVVIAGIYRTPNYQTGEFLERLDRTIATILNTEKYLIMVGDFNIDFLKSEDSKEIKNILNRHGMKYLVKFPTRVTPSCESCIDNIFTNINTVQTRTTGVITMLSDHDGQLLELINFLQINNENLMFKGRTFSAENMIFFKSLLEKEDWLTVYNSPVHQKYDCFASILKYYFDLSFPVCLKKYNNNKKTWITEQLKAEKNSIIQLQKLARKNKCSELQNSIKIKNKRYKLNLVNAKRRYFDSKITNSENVSKTTWTIINDETKKYKDKNHHNFILKDNNKDIHNPLIISNKFNFYFVNIIEELLKKEAQSSPTQQHQQHFHFTSPPKFNCFFLEEKELSEIFDSLKNKWSSGYDEMPIKVLKFVKLPLIKPIQHLINSSFISGIFPQKLKMSKVTPVYKKGEKTDIQNYRPISVLPSVSKIFEKAMHNRLVEHLVKYNLIDEEQHGFCKNKSTITALVKFTELIIDSIDNKENTLGIFMDLSKAFDSISHYRLIKQLQRLGVSGTNLNWFESYLVERHQYVEISHVTNKMLLKFQSKTQKIKQGIPQGSILGPLLFICYMIGMPKVLTQFKNVKSQICLYADDTNLVMSGKLKNELEVASHIQLANIKQFFRENQLMLNINKTNLISFKTKQNKSLLSPYITIDNESIPESENTKFLGLYIDENLSWDVHVNHIINKINSGIYALKRMTYFCNLTVLKIIFHAHVQSHIAYGISIYGSTSQNNLNKILTLQKKALRIMLNLNFDDSVRQHFIDLNILTVYNLYILDCIVYVKKNKEQFRTHNQTHFYNTRNKYEIVLPRHNLEFFNKKTSCSGVKFLKYIPQYIKNINDEKKFKKELKSYLCKNIFYSFQEFYDSHNVLN